MFVDVFTKPSCLYLPVEPNIRPILPRRNTTVLYAPSLKYGRGALRHVSEKTNTQDYTPFRPFPFSLLTVELFSKSEKTAIIIKSLLFL